jgi:subtilisin-like proprotein convertase family protein
MGKFICSCFVFLNLVLVGCDSGGGGDSNYSSSSSVAVVTPGLGAGGTGGTAFITPPSGAATTVTSGVPYSFSATVSGVTGTGGFAATIDTLIGDVSIDGLSVCFEPCFDLTPVAFGVFTSNAVVIRGSVPSAFVGIGTVQITIIYAEEDLEIISTFVVNVVGVASTLSFNPVSPASITAGDPLSVTATGSPAGGTFSSTGANAGTTGGTFSAINPTSGVFTFTGSTATGTASVNITYIGPGAAPVTLPYTVNVSAVVLNPLLVCDTPCGGLADNAPTPFNLLVTGGPNSIADLNVFLDLTHTFPGDLDITLTSPTGTVVELTSDNGGTTDDLFATVTFDDEAVASIVTITAPGGVFQPEGALSGFDGENANGTWTLNVVDDAGGDVGTLRSWCLAFDGVAVVNPNANCTTLVPLLTCVTPNTTLADTATTNVFVTITGGPTAISDLNVLMNVTHTFPGDLDITLTSPAGTVIDLTSDNGGGTDHLYSSVTLDDGAATSVTTIAAANGTFQPEQLLSTFNGENANGVWTLAFTDDAGGDVGCVGTVCLAFDGVALVNPNNTCFPVTLTPFTFLF